ncbi:MAG: hypothetical protein Tsb005_07770 [Gammaproteobacteria bacterium]
MKHIFNIGICIVLALFCGTSKAYPIHLNSNTVCQFDVKNAYAAPKLSMSTQAYIVTHWNNP